MTEAPSYNAAIETKHIRRRTDARPMNEDAVAGLVASITEIGLINPIRVRAVGRNDYEVVAGHHRLEACKRAGWADIPCIVVAEDDLHAELAMIDENLMRAELSASERAQQTHRRKAIYEDLHPETKNGATGNGREKLRQVGEATFGSDNKAVDRFTADTAAATGKSERAVQRDAERGEKVIPEVMEMIRGTKLDTGAYLDKLKKLPPNEQVHAAKRDLARARPKPAQGQNANDGPRQGGVAGRYVPAPAAELTPTEAFQRFLKLADELFDLDIGKIIGGSGRQRSLLGQRAASLGHRMDEIAERLGQ